ncbi:hypothetical protein J5690_04710 [bacterium]|nr:hypothetical protein [bacterium]
MFEIAAYFLGSLILFIFIFFIERNEEQKKKKHRTSFLKNKPIVEFDCDIINGSDKIQATLLATHSFYRIHTCVMLYEQSIVLTTGLETLQDEIMIDDIEFVSIKQLSFIDHLYIRQRVQKIPHKEIWSELYLNGDKKDLLYIKKFIEERMHKPQIIDLTGGDPTEQ